MEVKYLLASLLFLGIAVEEISSDGIVYKTPCCSPYRNVQDAFKETMDFIEMNGYIAEKHTVTTEDGYILALHRASGRLKEYEQNEIYMKPAVLLQHGISGTSDNWLLNGEKSLPIVLAKAGYDVWLADTRGNHYSKQHRTLPRQSPKFWDFSFHEQGYYDLPAMIDYILRTTGHRKIFYIGHSRGTTMTYVLLSTRPEYNDKFHLIVHYAPVVYLKHSRSPVIRAVINRTTDDFLKNFARTTRGLALPGINIRNKVLRHMFCGIRSVTQAICVRAMFLLSGFDYEQFNNTMLPLYVTHYPDGGSLKEYLHYIQIAHTDKFTQFDYGKSRNLELYGSEKPPEYDLDKITAPISLHYGANDFFVSPEDFEHLSSKLKSVVAKVRVPFDKFNHIDFIWGTRSDSLLYIPTLNLMKSFLKS